MQGGSIIRLFHKELEAFLVAEGLFDDEISEDGPLCYLLSLLTVSTLSSSLKNVHCSVCSNRSMLLEILSTE